ncbi:MAG: radical SAM protein [Desulfobacterota bacterium]|nr:radical SAM protein [Thermodesulfobacteriota bacterium]MDW8002012.1 radical SAM protein [Deltaproteobacteria bacterium]
MEIKEIRTKTVLTKSKIYEYTVNPYIGCAHACHYCYARFVKRFLGIKERWGDFVFVKKDAPEILKEEVKRKKKGQVWVSGISDPYQPIEKTLRLTRRCIETLLLGGFEVYIQTKSPLILDDIDILKSYENVHVFLTITTSDDRVREMFEPNAPPISERLEALFVLHSHGIKTHVMIAPLLLGAEGLVPHIKDKVRSVVVDKVNYHYADWVYKKNGIEWAKDESFFLRCGSAIKSSLDKEGVRCEILF